MKLKAQSEFANEARDKRLVKEIKKGRSSYIKGKGVPAEDIFLKHAGRAKKK